jgi:WD40-like Beta Propeller Repeat
VLSLYRTASSAYSLRVRPLVHYGSACFLFMAFLIPVQRARGQSQGPTSRELVWSAPGQEIVTPQFSPDGDFITLVTRGYVPDGADAEGLPDALFKALETKEKSNPRFADPVIKVIDLRGNVTCEVKYGWNPSLSRDDRRLVFSEQLKPITGFRALASPMDGNGIRMYDCGTKKKVKIADPRTGYFDRPFFSPDGGSIVYTDNEAVNGAFGGSVGIARFDLRQNSEISLVSKKTVAAVPCPPAGSKESGLEAFKCSQVKNLTSSFAQIVYDISPVGNEVVALLGMPLPTAGDMYMTDSYDMSLVSVFPVQRTVLSLGKRKAESWDETAFQAVSDERVLMFSQYWKLFSVSTGKQLPDFGPRNTNLKSIYSPDLKYYLRAEAAQRGEDPDHFALYRAADGKQLASLPRMALAYGALWSPESNRFAIVGVPMAGASATHHMEELVIYSVR